MVSTDIRAFNLNTTFKNNDSQVDRKLPLEQLALKEAYVIKEAPLKNLSLIHVIFPKHICKLNLKISGEIWISRPLTPFVVVNTHNFSTRETILSRQETSNPH